MNADQEIGSQLNAKKCDLLSIFYGSTVVVI